MLLTTSLRYAQPGLVPELVSGDHMTLLQICSSVLGGKMRNDQLLICGVKLGKS